MEKGDSIDFCGFVLLAMRKMGEGRVAGLELWVMEYVDGFRVGEFSRELLGWSNGLGEKRRDFEGRSRRVYGTGICAEEIVLMMQSCCASVNQVSWIGIGIKDRGIVGRLGDVWCWIIECMNHAE